MGSRAELRKVAELGLAESRGQLRRWSRHLDRGLQVGWSLATGQPVGNRPCSGLPCSFIGAAVWLAAPPPSGPGTVAWPHLLPPTIPQLLEQGGLCLHGPPTPIMQPKGRADAGQNQGPGEAWIPEVSEGRSGPASASSPLSGAPSPGSWGPPTGPELASPLVFPWRSADSLVSALPSLSGIHLHQSEVPSVRHSTRLW